MQVDLLSPSKHQPHQPGHHVLLLYSDTLTTEVLIQILQRLIRETNRKIFPVQVNLGLHRNLKKQ